MAESYPSLNGVAQSWADIKITINVPGGAAVPVTDIANIKYSRTVARGEQRGVGMEIKKRTRGQRSYSGGITFYAEGKYTLRAALLPLAPIIGGRPDLSGVAFDILVQHAVTPTSPIREVQMLGCFIDEESGDHSEGSDVDKYEVVLSVGSVEDKVEGVWTV